jgi:hypothetical protein
MGAILHRRRDEVSLDKVERDRHLRVFAPGMRREIEIASTELVSCNCCKTASGGPHGLELPLHEALPRAFVNRPGPARRPSFRKSNST